MCFAYPASFSSCDFFFFTQWGRETGPLDPPPDPPLSYTNISDHSGSNTLPILQMAEIRQLLNIIEQLEKKLGLEAGHSMRLRLEKDSLYDMLKKSSTFDAWDRMMSSGKSDPGQATPTGTLVSTFCLYKYILSLSSFEFPSFFVGEEQDGEQGGERGDCTRNKFTVCFCCWGGGGGKHLPLHTPGFFGDQPLLSHEICENTFFNQQLVSNVINAWQDSVLELMWLQTKMFLF